MIDNKLRFVIDTNVFVSFLLFEKGTPWKAVTKAFELGSVLLSEVTLLELNEVLHRPKFDKYVSLSKRQLFLQTLVQKTQKISITTTVVECRDPKDDKFLELAVSGESDYLISGDPDLLILHPFRKILILNPGDFLRQSS